VRVVAAAAVRRQGTDDSPRILFEKLDADGDGQLTADDFRNAQHLLRKLDLDRDELISTGELVQTANLFQIATASSPNAEPPKPKFLTVAAGQSSRQVAQQLLSARDGHNGAAKDNRLSFAELGLPDEKLSPFDADGDGSLDFEETQQLMADPPADIELIVRLGKHEPGLKGLEVVGSPEARNRGESASLTLGTVQMEFAQGDVGYSDSRVRAVSLEESITRNFKAADTDNNDYLEQNEAIRLGVNPQTFPQLDTDKDGKLFLKEYLAFYLPMAEMEQARVLLDIADRGRDLFRILDTSSDGRLGPREFAAAADRLSDWDRNGDGKLAQNEIAHQFHISVGRGSVSPSGRVLAVSVANRPMAMPRPTVTGGPAWFARMDRNGDGDVSAREFLGPAELFAKYDTDSNGLLDVKEATAAEKSAQ
jgi:Ca2+-binding EF-hand superfamily protein